MQGVRNKEYTAAKLVREWAGRASETHMKYTTPSKWGS